MCNSELSTYYTFSIVLSKASTGPSTYPSLISVFDNLSILCFCSHNNVVKPCTFFQHTLNVETNACNKNTTIYHLSSGEHTDFFSSKYNCKQARFAIIQLKNTPIESHCVSMNQGHFKPISLIRFCCQQRWTVIPITTLTN
jgi:hypothetical protein